MPLTDTIAPYMLVLRTMVLLRMTAAREPITPPSFSARVQPSIAKEGPRMADWEFLEMVQSVKRPSPKMTPTYTAPAAPATLPEISQFVNETVPVYPEPLTAPPVPCAVQFVIAQSDIKS